METKDSHNEAACFNEQLTDFLLPLLFGARLAAAQSRERLPVPPVSYHGRHRLRIAPHAESPDFFTLERKIPFTEEERSFVEHVVMALREPDGSGPADVNRAVEWAIARGVSPEHAQTVFEVLQVYKGWSAANHNGSGHNTGIYLSRSKGSGGSLFTLRDEPCLKAMGASADTLLAIGRSGDILGVEKIPPRPSDHRRFQQLAAPLCFADIALWTSGRKSAVRLCPDGSLLVFSGKRLLFMRRGGRWRSFPHSLAGINELLPITCPSPLPPDMRRAMFLTCLDLSFAGQNACIGIVPDAPDTAKRLERICGDALFTSDNLSGGAKLMADLVKGKKFQDLPRSFRMEMAAMNGPLILNGQGRILSAGAGFCRCPEPLSILETARAFAEEGLGVAINEVGGVDVFGARYG